jgi:hypothetical protein
MQKREVGRGKVERACNQGTISVRAQQPAQVRAYLQEGELGHLENVLRLVAWRLARGAQQTRADFSQALNRPVIVVATRIRGAASRSADRGDAGASVAHQADASHAPERW